MITGFNTDVDFEGVVYHVQTEDKGRSNPIIESLVYTGGQIVCARKSSYTELLAVGEAAEGEIQHRMEAQHRDLIREIREGTLSTEELQPFGWSVISNRSFDDVVRGFLEEHMQVETIHLQLLNAGRLEAGTPTILSLAVTEETTERPLCGASVAIRLVGADGSEAEAWSATTDADGRVEGPLDVPRTPGAAVVCAVSVLDKTAELRCKVGRRGRLSIERA